jgi:polyphosphate glucokinase
LDAGIIQGAALILHPLKLLKKIGKKKWNKRMAKVIEILKTVFNYDHLYISGGNAKLLTFKLDKNISIDDNKEGIKGGAVLWNEKEAKV